MPGIVVSLREALGVRGAPLAESDVWAILNQSAVYFNKITRDGNKTEAKDVFVVTPESLCFCSDGGVELSGSSQTTDTQYLPPELQNAPVKTLQAAEKCFIFSLGKSLIKALEVGYRNQAPSVSRNLESVLTSMCNVDPEARITVNQVVQACSLYAERHSEAWNSSLYTKKIYSSIMGSDSSEEEHTSGSHSSRHDTFSASSRGQRSRGRQKYTRRRERQRSRSSLSRSRSPSRSRSRSRSRHRERRHDDIRDHQSQKENFSVYHPNFTQPPTYHEHLSMTPGRSYHLSDITFTSALNGGQVQGQNRSRSGSGIGAHMNETAQQKYLRLKERQKKLKILRRGLMGVGYEDHDPASLTPDPQWSDTRSVLSGMSFTQGSYTPGLHMKHGSDIALRLGRDSDRDSIISSEMSLYQDQQLRSKDHMTYREKLTSRNYNHNRLSQEVEMEQKLDQLKNEFYRTAEENKGLKKQVHHGSLAGKSAFTHHDSHKPREFYGPEFVHKSSKPLVRIPVPLQGESLRHPSHVRRVVVVLLTGQKLEAMVDPAITAQQMFESVITHIELPEFFFFGLTYINEGEHCFIEPDMKLHKVAPEGWKDHGKESAPALTLTLYVRVKFYPSSVSLLRHQISKHLLYLQLRHDILEERTLCDEDQCVELSALALQAEYGDYDPESMGKNYFLQEHYCPHRVVKRLGSVYIRDHATEEHKKLAGLTDRQAEIEFIKKASKLQEYGIHYYKLQKSKNNTADIIWVGINVHSLLLAENELQGRRIVIQQFPWQSIKKLSFNKRRFSIQSKPDHGTERPPKLNYYTNSYRKGRYLLQFSTAQHRFELSMRSKESNIDPQELTLDSVAEFLCDESMVDDEQSSSESHGASATEPTVGLHSTKTEGKPLPYSLPPPYKAETCVSMLDLRQKYKLPSDKKRERYAVSTGDIFHESQREEARPPYVIEMGDQSSNLDGDMAPNETVNTTLQKRFDEELLSPERCERHLCEIVLKKEAGFGFGITIVGGESTDKLDLGIYVKVVTPGGPAHRDGRIRSGDRLIAINDQNLEGVQHHEAVAMIRHSGDTVRLLVSQVRVPKSFKRREDHDDALAKLRASIASPSDMKIYRQISEGDHDYQEDSDHFHVGDIPHNHTRDDPSVADVSTMSQIESIESEIIPLTDLPQDTQPIPSVRDPDDTENDVESDVDSDLEEGIEEITKGRGLNRVEPQRTVQSADLNEWQSAEAQTSGGRVEILPGEVFEVTLDKEGALFGLRVTGGKNTSVKFGGIYVKSIDPNSVTAKQNSPVTVQPGDRILAVAEIPMKNVTHKQAVEIIQNAPDVCTFTVERGSCSISSRSSVRSSNSSTGSVVESRPPGQRSPGTGTPVMPMFPQGEKQLKNHDLDLMERSESESKSTSSSKGGSTAVHGQNSYNDFTESEQTENSTSVESNVLESNKSDNRDQRVVIETPLVKDAQPESLESTGLLSSGEVDLELQGGGVLQRESSGLTDASEESIPTNDGNIYYPFVNKDNTFMVDLNKGPSGLGFSVYGGVDVDTGDQSQGVVRIKKVFPLGPAKSSQQIQRDDVLLEVNGVPVKGRTHAEVVSLLHSVVSNVKLLMCRPSHHQLAPLPRSSSEEWMERRAAARLEDPGTPSETESEDEPILYRDTLPDQGMITPPSGFASPTGDRNPPNLFVPPPTSPPPPLPRTPPPSLSLQNSPLPPPEHPGLGRWGDFENLRAAVSPRSAVSPSPRSMYSDEFNSTFNSTQESTEVFEGEDKGRLIDLAGIMKRSRSSSSQSDASESSTDSIVRSPLKGTYNTGEGLQSSASESGLDAILSKNNKLLGTGTNSLQSSEIPSDEEDPSLGDTEQYRNSPNAPRGSPTAPSSTPRDSPQLNVVINQDTLNQSEAGDEVAPESDVQESNELLTGEIEVELMKDEKKGLGFSVYGGVSKGGCYIRDIVSDPALTDGRLKTGDRLLQVNGTDLTKLSHTDAVGHLRNAQGQVKILVYRPPQHSTPVLPVPQTMKRLVLSRREELEESEEETEEGGGTMNSGYEPDSMMSTSDLTSVTQPDMIQLELDRTCPGGLGFSLVTAEKDHQTGVFVRSILPNSQADRDGRLQVMDRIVQINGESTVGLTHSKATQLIKASPNKVTLTVSRFSARQLETMTPPILLNSDDEDEEDFDDVDEDNADPMIGSLKEEEVYDSEDDDMDALVNEAEKLLLSSGSLELSERALNEGNLKTPGASYQQWKAEDCSLSDENNDVSEYETQGTEELHEGLRALMEGKRSGGRSQTFTINSIQRKLEVEVPEVLTNQWLDRLPLVLLAEEVKGRVPLLISKLEHTLDQKNHQEEYKELRQVKSTDDCTVAKFPENKPLNRFRNILPYDFNRVELGDQRSYINASHILMNVGEMEAHYIAAQGPLPHTSDHFWQMIWEQNVSVVAMLTLDVENGKVKCHQYWPHSVETPLSVCNGLYKLSLLRVQSLEHFEIREIMIENRPLGTGRLLYHFMFTNWPDQATPNTIPLLQYLQLIHAHHTTGPILVHCSAGIGRTGALITIDLALAQIERKGRCDIFEIVSELRKQRYGMIQVKDQYTLSYLACLDALRTLSS
ncbi:tyrosine-protein phosphatase non-receptor type 13-like isoform X2 [Crassostrea virginica]